MPLDLRAKNRELEDSRQTAIKAARQICEDAETRGEPMNAEENANYDKAVADAERHAKQIDDNKRLIAQEERAARDNEPDRGRVDLPDLDTRRDKPAGSPETELTIRGQKLRFGERSIQHRSNTDEYRSQFWEYISSGRVGDQLRALQMDSDTAGGYLIPSAFDARLIEAVDDMVWIRGLADVVTVPNADSLGRPSRDADVADTDWTTELATGSEDSTLAFGKRELTPHPLAKRLKISRKLIRAGGAIDVESYAMGRLAYKRAVTQEKAFLTGSGSQQPLGVFTASSSGISTTRDVSTDNTTTAITADNLKRCFYTLKMQYRSPAVWVFHRDAVSQIMRLKDGEGNYLLTQMNNQPGVDNLFGRPIYESEFAPNTFTTGLYLGIIGDFRNYMIADALGGEMQRLDELYAETNQIGLIDRSETDGMPVLEEAFVRVTLA